MDTCISGKVREEVMLFLLMWDWSFRGGDLIFGISGRIEAVGKKVVEEEVLFILFYLWIIIIQQEK